MPPPTTPGVVLSYKISNSSLARAMSFCGQTPSTTAQPRSLHCATCSTDRVSMLDVGNAAEGSIQPFHLGFGSGPKRSSVATHSSETPGPVRGIFDCEIPCLRESCCSGLIRFMLSIPLYCRFVFEGRRARHPNAGCGIRDTGNLRREWAVGGPRARATLLRVRVEMQCPGRFDALRC